MDSLMLEQLKAISEKVNCFEAKPLIEYVSNHDEEKFHLLILGEFKRGKSSLVNKLLDFDIIPSDILPCTATLNVIEYGEPSITIHHHSGQVVDLPIESKVLEPYTAEYSENIDDIAYIKIKSKHALLEAGLVIIDTPGVNDISQSRVEITKKILPHADAALFLLDSHAPVTKSEAHFLKSQVYGNSIEQIIFVISKADRIDEDEIQDVIEGSKKRLNDLLDIDAKIIPFSIKKMDFQNEMVKHINELANNSKATFEERSRNRLLLAIALLIEAINEQLAVLSIDEEMAFKKRNMDEQKIKQDEMRYYHFSDHAKSIGEPILLKIIQTQIDKFRNKIISDFSYRIEMAQDVTLLQNQLAIEMTYRMKALTDQCSHEINQYLLKVRGHIIKEYSRHFNEALKDAHEPVVFNEVTIKKVQIDKVKQTIENIAPISLGLIVGSLILPGVGTIIGSALGQIIGTKIRESKNEAMKEELLEALPKSVDLVLLPFEDQVQETIREAFRRLHESVNRYHHLKLETRKSMLPLLLVENKSEMKNQLNTYLEQLRFFITELEV